MTPTGAENIASIAPTLHGIFTTVGAGVRCPVAATDKLSSRWFFNRTMRSKLTPAFTAAFLLSSFTRVRP
jgi:hypothetical protein